MYESKPNPRFPGRSAVEIGDVVELTVVALEGFGAFLDWGKEKELFLPFAEQTRPIRAGDRVIIYVYIDNNQRACASMKIEKFLEKGPGQLREGDPVCLLVFSQTELGFKAVVNGRHIGILYGNELYKPVRVGQRVDGFIQKIRDDGKIDLTLQERGYAAAEDIGEKILMLLESRGGFLPVNDNSSPEVISDLFGVSKKKFKMALGGLYKKQLVTLDAKGITLKRA